MEYTIIFTKQAERDKKKVFKNISIKKVVGNLLIILAKNPYSKNPPYEKLVGNLEGALSRRINKQHRLVYQVVEDGKFVKVLSMWTHYESIK